MNYVRGFADSHTTVSAVILAVALVTGGRSALAADADVEDLKRAIQALQAENRQLASRLAALESSQAVRSAVTPSLPVTPLSTDQLTQRVRELEISKAANEQATRQIIQDSLSKTGSRINDAVSLGGSIEMLLGRSSDFSGNQTDALKLNTAELDLEIQVNPWTLGSFAIKYVDGTGVRTGSGTATATAIGSAVDRINLDRAYFTIGDLQRFPLYLRVGRQPLPFGTSSGVQRADVLSVDSPLTVEAFEMKKTAVGLGFGLPTPSPVRLGPPVFAPPVKPLLFGPLINQISQGLGYRPVAGRIRQPNPIPEASVPPPFYGSIYLYDSSDTAAPSRSYTSNVSARLGYRTSGHCGRKFSELSNSGWCPWTVDVNVDYNSSIFDSKFLAAEYSGFADQFGPVKGLAANAKLTLGRVSLTGEWNGASERAQFRDGLGNGVSIQPTAWQISAGYQFDWNPWVTSIGGQGTFAAVGYSETRDLAGVALANAGTTSRVGFLPKQRLTMTLGEWLADGVKLVFEYSLTKDYPVSEGGTGSTGSGLTAVLTYAW